MHAPLQYLTELRDELSLYPAWLPNDPIELGSYGRFDKGRFVVDGRLADLGIDLETKTHERKRGFQKHRGVKIAASGATTATATATAGLVDASLGANMEFTRTFAWAFGAQGVRSVEIHNITQVNKKVQAAKKMNAWDSSWLLVTEIREVSCLNVVVARAKNVKVGVKGKGTLALEEILLAADASLEYKAEDVFTVENEENTTPLFALRKLSFWSKGLRPADASGTSSEEELVVADAESFNL